MISDIIVDIPYNSGIVYIRNTIQKTQPVLFLHFKYFLHIIFLIHLNIYVCLLYSPVERVKNTSTVTLSLS